MRRVGKSMKEQRDGTLSADINPKRQPIDLDVLQLNMATGPTWSASPYLVTRKSAIEA